MQDIYNYSLKELQTLVEDSGFKKFSGTQVFEWLYTKRVTSFEEMSNLSLTQREWLANNFTMTSLNLVQVQSSKDGTRKYLFELSDGEVIETVLMPHDYGYSLCVTTQVGCNMNCSFCASGIMGKTRNLQPGEVVNQVLTIQKELDQDNQRISSIVYMGIGEPFDNYDNIKKSLDIIIDQKGLNIGARHITVSTSGIVPKIIEFGKDFPQVGLAISLHGTNDELRTKLMPVNKKYPLEELINALREYNDITNRRITIEYILINKVNDNEQNAKELVSIMKRFHGHVNLIPLNIVMEKEFFKSDSKRIEVFKKILEDAGVNVTRRREKGADIDAACGQLRNKNKK